ncbi:TM2 domain-containing protein [Alienimonas californiensis]|uniref:TM2 domain protein n=1 Tax=Alienimonas californiensis TaxID=2527989 RepID=A0A517P937_9PLAN|nr:TM2 domain-containing protein [Alienimonas californiensis]QDT15896.1 TM2 domain protein [Alienimonas californiensis]
MTSEPPPYSAPPPGEPHGYYVQKHPGAEKKILAGVLGIAAGGLGVHKFVLGMTTPGIIMLAVTVGSTIASPCLFFVPLLAPVAMTVIGLIEGVIYLTKSDEEFYQTYMVEKKEWF